MTPAEFDARVNALLDARRDPLDDPRCCAFLAEHPQALEALEAFAALRERLAALPDLAAPLPVPVPVAVSVPSAFWRPAPWLLLAAAAAGLFLAWPDATPAIAAETPRGRVLAASLVPIHPTLGASGTARARAVLLDRPDARLETFVQWGTP